MIKHCTWDIKASQLHFKVQLVTCKQFYKAVDKAGVNDRQVMSNWPIQLQPIRARLVIVKAGSYTNNHTTLIHDRPEKKQFKIILFKQTVKPDIPESHNRHIFGSATSRALKTHSLHHPGLSEAGPTLKQGLSVILISQNTLISYYFRPDGFQP